MLVACDFPRTDGTILPSIQTQDRHSAKQYILDQRVMSDRELGGDDDDEPREIG